MTGRSLYHLVPEDMIGSTLRPLSGLAEIAPERYESALARYQDDERRRQLPERIIPKLDCRWQDTVQLAPVHPGRIFDAWAELGVRLDPTMRWFQLSLVALRDAPAVVYEHPDRFSWLDRERYRELPDVPEDAKAWYAELAARGKRGAWFHKVPHVLVRGNVDVSQAGVLEWGSA